MTELSGLDVPVRLSARRSTTPEPVLAHGPHAGITERGPELLPLDAGQHYRFGFDMGACIGCHSCEVACAEQNGLPPGTTWRRVGEVEGGDHPHTRRFHLSMSCNHCLEPACLEGCPTNAYVKLDNGVVAHHAEDCIGCQYCTWNCPYSVPVFQPDRRVVTKCDLCQPRLAEGLTPACVAACPTHAITVERVDVEAWRADHAAGDAPQLPSADLTLSTTRIKLPPGWPGRPRRTPTRRATGTCDPSIPTGPSSGSPWSARWRWVPAPRPARAASGWWRPCWPAPRLVGALFHLGRPVAAWKALRNLRRSWLSREVAVLSAYAGLAVLAALVPGGPAWLVAGAAVVGALGVYCSARLYVVPGRPAWNSPLTIVRFFATSVALGPALTGRLGLAAAGAAVALAATALNWWRLGRHDAQPWWGSVRLELRWFRSWTVLRYVLGLAGIVAALAGAPRARRLRPAGRGRADRPLAVLRHRRPPQHAGLVLAPRGGNPSVSRSVGAHR